MSDIAIFLTGTGTGVGKTVAGCIIAAHWAAQGRSPRVMKPAESGCALRDGYLVPATLWRSGRPRATSGPWMRFAPTDTKFP